jgi:hypothetical protein
MSPFLAHFILSLFMHRTPSAPLLFFLILQVSTHRFGCCVLQAAVDHGTKGQQDQLIDAIEAHCAELTRDPFGNYAVQHVLDLARQDIPLRLVQKFEVRMH